MGALPPGDVDKKIYKRAGTDGLAACKLGIDPVSGLGTPWQEAIEPIDEAAPVRGVLSTSAPRAPMMTVSPLISTAIPKL